MNFRCLRALINPVQSPWVENEAVGWGFIALSELFGIRTKYSESYSELHGFIFVQDSQTDRKPSEQLIY